MSFERITVTVQEPLSSSADIARVVSEIMAAHDFIDGSVTGRFGMHYYGPNNDFIYMVEIEGDTMQVADGETLTPWSEERRA